MDLNRVRKEIEESQRAFSYVESHVSTDGKPYILCALQTLQSKIYTLSVSFPDTYPSAMPIVFVRKPGLSANVPHRYTDGHLCYLHPKMWNPGLHNLTFVIGRAAKWLNKYEVWLETATWPGAQMAH